MSSCNGISIGTNTLNNNNNNNANNNNNRLINWHMLRQPDALFSMFFAILPFGITGFASFRVYQYWKYEYFYNVFQIRIASIVVKKSQFPGYLSHFHSHSKFKLLSETLWEDELKNIIPTVRGQKLITKYAKKTRENNSLIKIQNDKNHKIILHYICNKITQLNYNANLYRDIGINLTNLKVDKCGYIVCLLCLKYPNYNDENDIIYETSSNSSGSGNSSGENKKIINKNLAMLMKEGWNCKKIRAILIKEDTIKNMINLIKDEWNVNNICDISDKQWSHLLYITHLKDYSNIEFAFWRWNVIKEIIQQYDSQPKHECDGSLCWGEPLGTVSVTYIVPNLNENMQLLGQPLPK